MPAPKYDWVRIEEEATRTEGKIPYDYLAEKYNVPKDNLYKRAYEYNWNERHEKFLRDLAEQRDRDRIAAISETYNKLDKFGLKVLEGLFRHITLNIHEADQRQEKLQPEELGKLTTSYRQLMSVLKDSKGDTAIALNHLIDTGIIPPDFVPQISGVLEDGDSHTAERLTAIFRGRVFLPD